ncbi:MAG: choice-of-anchor tandem repeat GloVer-containing protein [Terriglobales bacterium]
MQSRESSFALSIVKGAAVMLVLLSGLAAFAGATTTYTENTIYSFYSNSPDGVYPTRNGLVMDKAGNLYGTTINASCALNELCVGAVFELSPNGSGGWTETVLHLFDPLSTIDLNDGANPTGNIAIDSKGNLYGTCFQGGPGYLTGPYPYQGSGIVWELSPPAPGSGNPWTETVLYSFGAPGSGDGYRPYGGVTLASSAATVLYGTTSSGGANNDGTLFELSYVKKTKTVPAHWTETILHSFYGPDGLAPVGELLLSGGNLYGYAPGGAYEHTDCYQCGVVFELQPGAGGWTENVLYNFGGSTTDAWFNDFGGNGAPVIDAEKNLYGTTDGGGNYGKGSVWELVYSAATETYSEQVIYSFGENPDYVSPDWGLVYSKGSLFGATGGASGPLQGGSVFELTYTKPTKKAPGGWQERDLYDFPAASFGAGPGFDQLIEDSKGNWYGLLPGVGYGTEPYGAVFELSPSTP